MITIISMTGIKEYSVEEEVIQKMIENMLKGIEVKLSVDYFDIKIRLMPIK